MINPALLKALIPQDVMDNVQNAAQAFIEMRNDIADLKAMVKVLHDDRFGQTYTNGQTGRNLLIENVGGLSPDNRSGKD